MRRMSRRRKNQYSNGSKLYGRGQCNYGDRCESCNGKGEVTIEEEDVEIKLLNLEIEILGTLEGLKRYQEKAPKEWEHLNTYKEATIKIELLTTLSKLI